MATNNLYELSFAGVPFLADESAMYDLPGPAEKPKGDDAPVVGHQPCSDLIDELNRILPWHQFDDFTTTPAFPGRNLSSLTRRDQDSLTPNAQRVRIGEWWYPSGACRWSVFRGLMTSSMVAAVLKVVSEGTAATFRMKCPPFGAVATAYTIETPMRMLPPRPLAEHGGGFDGLYLVTLADERYWWQNAPVHPSVASFFRVNQNSTWSGLIDALAFSLGVTISYSTIGGNYSRPEPDSQLWSSLENAAVLMDAVAANLGRQLVRRMDGVYLLEYPEYSAAAVSANIAALGRGPVRTAGGDIFQSGRAAASTLKVGDLRKARNTIVPSEIVVSFPQYAVSDPLPHFFNKRYANQRPTNWSEDGYGGGWYETVPIASGGRAVSGLTGVSTLSIRTTAKALFSGEANATPFNRSGLVSLATQIAYDHWNWQATVALDESFPGTFAWTPEGIHDIVWTWSARLGRATTRIIRNEWNRGAFELQHAAPAMANATGIPAGAGGKSVALTVADSTSGIVSGSPSLGPSASLVAAMTVSGGVMVLAGSDLLPTGNRWRARVENETMLMEGTSGGVVVGVAHRGIDGTMQATHAVGTVVRQIVPNVNYGTNLLRAEKGQFVFPGIQSSGGISEAHLVPQVQNVLVLDGSGTYHGTDRYYSGQIQLWNWGAPGRTSNYIQQEYVFVVERNEALLVSGHPSSSGLSGPRLRTAPIRSGEVYEGMMLGFSPQLYAPVSPQVAANKAPVYGVKQPNWYHGAKYFQPKDVTIATDDSTIIEWCKLEWDTMGMHQAASWSRFIAPVNGVYLLTADLHGLFSNVATGADKIKMFVGIYGPSPQGSDILEEVAGEWFTFAPDDAEAAASLAVKLSMAKDTYAHVVVYVLNASVTFRGQVEGITPPSNSFTMTLLAKGFHPDGADNAECTTTTPTPPSTTSTTVAPCGTCDWVWRESLFLWEISGTGGCTQIGSPSVGVDSACACAYPTRNGTFDGEMLSSNCGKQTTTTTTACPTTTTPAVGVCGICNWKWVVKVPATGAGTWVGTSNTCTGACACAYPNFRPCIDCVAPATCATITAVTNCAGPGGTTTTPPPCGTCRFYCNGFEWIEYSNNCTSGTNCVCPQPPSRYCFSAPPTALPCIAGTPTTTSTTASGTTTTTASPCGDCTYACNGFFYDVFSQTCTPPCICQPVVLPCSPGDPGFTLPCV